MVEAPGKDGTRRSEPEDGRARRDSNPVPLPGRRRGASRHLDLLDVGHQSSQPVVEGRQPIEAQLPHGHDQAGIREA